MEAPSVGMRLYASPRAAGSVRFGRLFEARDFVGERGAAHVAHLGVIVAPGTVHGDAVVPHHEVPRLPDMGIDELALGGVFGEVAQEGPRLGYRPALDAAGVAGEVERQPAGVGMA